MEQVGDCGVYRIGGYWVGELGDLKSRDISRASAIEGLSFTLDVLRVEMLELAEGSC